MTARLRLLRHLLSACALALLTHGALGERPFASNSAHAPAGNFESPWWQQVFSLAFDGHGNFVAPHLDALHAAAASLGPAGYHGVWDADLNRDAGWMRRHLVAFDEQPRTKRLVYIEGASASRVLCRADADGRIVLTHHMLLWLNDPARRDDALRRIQPDGRTVWFGDWQFMQSHPLKSSLGHALPGAAELGLPPFTHPLTGAVITDEGDFWHTRSAGPGGKYVRLTEADAELLDLASVTTRNKDGEWLVEYGGRMLYDAQFAPYQAAKAQRAMAALAPDMIHYDDWDLRSPGTDHAKSAIHVAAFRDFMQRRFNEDDCRALGFEKDDVAAFDLYRHLRSPPWLAEFEDRGRINPEAPFWWAARDPRWLSNKIWRAFQIACIENRLASMQETYRLFKQHSRETLGREIPMVANIIPTLSCLYLQRDCVDMASFEWPCYKNYNSFPKPFGYYPDARLGLGPRMAAKIGVTGHAMVAPYVEKQYCGWDGQGFTKRQYETLHKVITFDLLANRGIPAFALTWDGGYSPGSIHSAGQLHTFVNQVAPILSQRHYIADIGLASSSWSRIAAATPFAGWFDETSKRHFAEFVGWSQYLMSARDFPQWDVLPFDDVTPEDLARFKLVVLPSVLVVTADQFAALETYLKQGGRLLVTGETGTFFGPEVLLMPRARNLAAGLKRRYPDRVTITEAKPGLAYHLAPANSAPVRDLLRQAGEHPPVLTVANAPEHVAVYLSQSKARPGVLTLDLVNHAYDLADDRITPVTATDFTVALRLPASFSSGELSAEAIRYDETAPHNTRRQALPGSVVARAAGRVTLRVPPFTHYQILRLSRSGAREPEKEKQE
ncbi:MAG: hypothetical protein HN383_15575 [Verrucomicrobia bacterium]|jgi:hypothetical protein|nr:hypothetical protein [Verrucomicrobiota bacterium]